MKSNPAFYFGVGENSENILTRSSNLSQAPSFTAAQEGADRAVSSFLEGATDRNTLFAVLMGGLAYRFGRIGTLLATSHWERSGLFPLLVRGGSCLAGFGTESMVFAGVQRALKKAEGKTPVLSFSQEWAHAALTLAPLKILPALFQEQNFPLRHLLADVGMIAGSHLAYGFGAGEKPRGDLFQQFFLAETMNWQMKAGLGFLYGAAPEFVAFEAALDLEIRSRELNLPVGKRGFRTFSFAVKQGTFEEIAPTTLQMSAEGEGGGSGKKSGGGIEKNSRSINPDEYSETILKLAALEHWETNPEGKIETRSFEGMLSSDYLSAVYTSGPGIYLSSCGVRIPIRDFQAFWDAAHSRASAPKTFQELKGYYFMAEIGNERIEAFLPISREQAEDIHRRAVEEYRRGDAEAAVRWLKGELKPFVGNIYGDSLNSFAPWVAFGLGLDLILDPRVAHAAALVSEHSLSPSLLPLGLTTLALGGMFHWAAGKIKKMLSREDAIGEEEKPLVAEISDPYRTSVQRILGNENEDPLLQNGSNPEYHGNGILKKIVLNRRVTVEGFESGFGNWAAFHPNGKLRSIRITASHTVGGIDFPRFSRLEFDEEGRLQFALLSESLEIDGVRCAKDSWAHFHRNGKLRSAMIIDPFGEDPVLSGGKKVEFDERGRLLSR